MQNQNFTTTLLVDQTPTEAFEAIKNVRGWWSGLHSEAFSGNSDKLNDEFTFRAGDSAHYTKQKLVALIPDKKITWLVTESKLTFVENQTEWTGTKISFDISKENNKTKIVFTHEGLVPELECYNSCTPAWTQYIQERLLLSLIKKSPFLPENK
ncbi:MAG: SRPBCC domain-containing protein [Ferruginibacter sp.]